MFTGIVTAIGTIESVEQRGDLRVRIACPFSGLQTHTLRSRQSYSPTCGYLPLNVSVQSFVLTRGPACCCPRCPNPNI